jgi:HEPN domain-containing protein/predicted nucleotidyltransferase
MTDFASALDLQTRYDQSTRRAVEILKGANPVRIIRFGSAAWGPLHQDSDLDLCVVVERIDERHIRDVWRNLSRTLWDQYRPGDVEIQLHVYYRDTFDDYLRREDPFLHEVTKGEVVYEAPSESSEPLRDASASYGSSRFEELAQTWLETATWDLAHAKSAQELGFYSHACFSCQQTGEKALKAYLFAQRQSLIRTHDLVTLLSHGIGFDMSFEDLREACTTLNEYYTDTRYPDTLRSDTTFAQEEADTAIACADTALGFIRSRIEVLLDGEAELWKSPSE